MRSKLIRRMPFPHLRQVRSFSRQRIAVIQEIAVAHKESWASFGRRIQAITGFSLAQIPVGEIADLRRRNKKVVCRRGNWFVVRIVESVVQREGGLEEGYTFESFDEAGHFRIVRLDD